MAYEPKRLDIDFDGALAASVDAGRIGPKNYKELINMRYSPGGGVKAVAGYSQIDTGDSTYLTENFWNYLETDTAFDRLLVAQDKITLQYLLNNETVSVARDFGAGFFTGSFEHRFSFKIDSGAGTTDSYAGLCLWTLVNSVGVSNTTRRAAGEKYMAVQAHVENKVSVGLGIKIEVTLSCSAQALVNLTGLALGTRYYVKVAYDGSLGTYGKMQMQIYSDAAFSVLVAGQFANYWHALNAAPPAFRYLLATSDEGIPPSTPLPGAGLIGDMSDLQVLTCVLDTGVQMRGGPLETSHLVVRKVDEIGDGHISEIKAEPPATGAFEDAVLWEDATGAANGSFCSGPDGGVIYANGKEVCIWHGPEMSAAAVFQLTDVVAAGTDISFTAAGDTIASVAIDFWAAGFRPGQKITVAGSTDNDNTLTLILISGTGNKTLTVLENVVVDEAAGASVTITALPSGNRETGVLDVTSALGNGLKTSGHTMSLGGGNDAYTKTLLHLDGNHGATATTDASGSGHSVTFNGDAKLTTLDKRFGTASLSLGGTGYLSMADSADWNLGAGLFTVDFWVNFDTLPGNWPNIRYIFEQRDSATSRFSVALSNNFVVVTIGDGSAVTSFYAGVSPSFVAGRWYHIAVWRDALGSLNVYVNGVYAGWGYLGATIPNMTADFEIGRGGGAGSYIYFVGKIDEWRWSKGKTRWADNPDSIPVPSVPYQTESKSFLAFSTRPLQGAIPYLASANTEVTPSVAVSAWNGNTMVPLAVTDGSVGFSVDAGAISFPSTVGMARPLLFDEICLYAYLFTLSAGSAEIYRLTLDAPFQALGDVWDGVPRTAIAFHVYTGSVDQDYTLEVAEASSVLYPIAADLSALATTGYVTMMFEERMSGLMFSMLAGATNANTARPAVSFHGPAGWVALGASRDGTALSTALSWVSLGQTGALAWDPPTEAEESPTNLFGVKGYAYRVAFSATLSASVKVDCCFGIPASKTVRPCDFPSVYGGRLLQCGYSEGGEGGRVDFSAPTAPEVNNGALSSDNGNRALYFGGNEQLVTGIEMFNRFGNDVHSFWLGLKKNETYILTGTDPEDYAVRLVSGSVGCVSRKAVCTVETGFEVIQGLGRNVAFWLSASGPVVFDGAVLMPVPGLERFFDEGDPDYVNPAALDQSVMWFDSAHGELNLALPLGTSTEPDLWMAFDLSKRAWFEKNPGALKYPLCAIPVASALGVRYVYAGNREGHLLRLENGPTWNGTAMTCEIETGDLMLAGAWDRALVSKVRLWGHLIGEAASAAISYTPDSGSSFTSLGAVDLAAGSGRLFHKTIAVNAQGWMMRFKVVAATSSVTPGLWLEGLGLEFTKERID